MRGLQCWLLCLLMHRQQTRSLHAVFKDRAGQVILSCHIKLVIKTENHFHSTGCLVQYGRMWKQLKNRDSSQTMRSPVWIQDRPWKLKAEKSIYLKHLHCWWASNKQTKCILQYIDLFLSIDCLLHLVMTESSFQSISRRKCSGDKVVFLISASF